MAGLTGVSLAASSSCMLGVKHLGACMPMKEFELNEAGWPVMVNSEDVSLLVTSPDDYDVCIIVMKNGREVAVVGPALLIAAELEHA